ncbi:MAG: multicopper oxidase domain-containing protein, partial [Curvibacter sp.]
MRRRELLLGLGLSSLASLPAQATGPRILRAGPATAAVAGQPTLSVWAYDARVPGPVLRYRRGQTLDLALHNALPDPTTIHWHGIRLPNAMDGVPGLTQDAVAPGQRFHYRFPLPDAGTYWYHPHWGTPEQLERGLAGALIVEDDEPPPVDRDLVWLLDDWRLDAQGRIAENFYNFHDVAHAGRLGQQLTVNGALQPVQALRTGERVRLRLVNAANARIFALTLEGLNAWLIARDGMPAASAVPWEGELLLGPGMRADFIVDAAAPGRYALQDADRRGERVLATFEVSGAPDARAARPAPRPAPYEPLPEPDLEAAHAHTLVLGGGALNREGRERLLAAFEKVNRHFQDLFVKLFGGGRAHLTMVEADDPLDAGLEIMASPPGKKLQMLSLLSGGEQALTATALV